MNRTLTLIFLLILSTVLPSAHAVEVEGLFSASVAVSDRSNKSFEEGLRRALVSVLSKASGKRLEVIEQESRIAQDIQDGHKFASLFSYYTEKSKVQGGADKQSVQDLLYLKASFPEQKVVSILRKGGFSFWPANRPLIVTWPAISINGHKAFATEKDQSTHGIYKAMERSANALGLPMLIANGGDKLLNGAWEWEQQQLLSASRELDAAYVLVSRMAVGSDGRVMGGWLLFSKDSRFSLDVVTDSYEEFIGKGFQWVVETLAPVYAVKLQVSGNEIVVNVHGINSEGAYQSVMAYLEDLDVVHNIYLLEAHDNLLSIAVALKTEPGQFEKVLDLDKKLLMVPGQQDSDYSMSLFWNEK